MLKAGDNKEKRIQRAAEELLQPDVLPNVQDWLTKITEKGKFQQHAQFTHPMFQLKVHKMCRLSI